MSPDEDSEPNSNPGDYTAADAVIDGYIQNLEKTKNDPEKKRKFIEEYTRQTKAREEEAKAKLRAKAQENQPDPLDDVDIESDDERPTLTDKRDPGRRVIPRGNPDQAIEDEGLDEEAEEQPKKGEIDLQGLDLDESVKNDATELARILKEQKIRGAGYILKSYFKRAYPTTGRAARHLNTILKNVAITPRMRRIVLDEFFEISQKSLDQIFDDEESDDDDEVSSKKKGKEDLPDADELIDYPILLPNGQIATKPDGSIVTMKMRMRDIRAMMMRQQFSVGHNGGTGNLLDIAEMMRNIQASGDSKYEKIQDRQIEFWQKAAAHDSLKDIDEWKTRLTNLGVVGTPEKPSAYQKEVISEMRTTGKDFLNETKDEVRPLIESIRDDFLKPIAKKILEEKPETADDSNKKGTSTKSPALSDIHPLGSDKDELFNVLNEAVNKELSKGEKHQ
jgi:hypothetical protein